MYIYMGKATKHRWVKAPRGGGANIVFYGLSIQQTKVGIHGAIFYYDKKIHPTATYACRSFRLASSVIAQANNGANMCS